MALWTNIQNSWVGGRLDAELMGRQDLERYRQGASELKNFVVRRQGYISKRTGTDFVCSLDENDKLYSFPGGKALIVNSRLGANTTYRFLGENSSLTLGYAPVSVIEIGDSLLGWFRQTNAVTGQEMKSVVGRIYGVSTPTWEELPLMGWNQSTPRPVMGSTTLAGKWTEDEEKPAKKTVSYKAALFRDGVEGYPAETAAKATYKLPWGNTCTITVKIGTTLDDGTKIKSTDKIVLYKKSAGSYGYIGTIDCGEEAPNEGKNAYEFVDDYIQPDATREPVEDTNDRFVNENNFSRYASAPRLVSMFQQRLVFANTPDQINGVWLSRTGDFYDFSTHTTVQDDDAIGFEIADIKRAEIHHIVQVRDTLLVFCDNAVWSIAPMSGNALTHKTVSARKVSDMTSAADVPPVLIGDEVIVVNKAKTGLVALQYSFSSDNYASTDISVLSQWVFKDNEITSMAYKQFPDSTIECTLKDGSVAACVYMKEQNICAWSRFVFSDGWRAVGVVTTDETRNGTTATFYIMEKNDVRELWRARDDLPVRKSDEVDGRMQLRLDRVTKFDGNYGLTGKTVVKYSDSDMYEGWQYEAKMTTVRPEPSGGAESIQTEIKNARGVDVRVLDSGDFTVYAEGVDTARATASNTGADVVHGKYATRDCMLKLAGNNTRDGRITLVSQNFAPLNILRMATTYQVEIADNPPTTKGNG